MNCLMLRKCLDKIDDESDDSNVNVQVSCACCGGTVKDTNIDQTDDNATTETDRVEQSRRTAIEDDILQSGTAGGAKLGSCFSCCCKGAPEEDKGMATETINLHTTQTRSEDVS